MKRFRADLHIHTALSPCAMDEMTPSRIVHAALERNLDMIAICDHNAAGNAAAVQDAAEATWHGHLARESKRITVIAGIEATTTEEVHVLGLFPDADRARAAADEVKATLPEATPEALKRFGEQPLFDAHDDCVGAEPRMLAMASEFSLESTVALIHRHEGLAVASHVDRPSFSIVSQLGLFPEDVRFDAIEISPVGVQAGRQENFAGLGLPMVASSDSHFLSDIGACATVFTMEAPTFAEVVLAFAGTDGRSCRIA